MSENAKPLWDDEEIEGFVRRNVPTASNIYVLLRSAMKMVRNDYESVRKNNQERVSRIEAELAAAQAQLAESDEAVVPQEVARTMDGVLTAERERMQRLIDDYGYLFISKEQMQRMDAALAWLDSIEGVGDAAGK